MKSLHFLLRVLFPIALLALSACQQQMADQPSYRPLEPSSFFRDGRSARPQVKGTIARGQLRDDSALDEGKDGKGQFVTTFPYLMTDSVLKRGQERFNVFCSPCHGQTGAGDGRIVQRGFTQPPNYATDFARGFKVKDAKGKEKQVRLRDVPNGYIFSVITHGYGAMPDYSSQVPVRDRWAIAGYVRALQYSQSPEYRQQFEKKGKKP